jgi:hypothetical protein
MLVGEGGSVDDRTVPEVAEGMRALFTVIVAGKLTCPLASRHRLEGDVVALEVRSPRISPVRPGAG